MGKSVDFSESIKMIREAHADAAAILEKWQALVENTGEITLTVKIEDGATQEVTVPTIREAISRYLGGTFEQVTLTDGTHSVILRMNDSGAVEVDKVTGTPENLIVSKLIATTIIGRTGALSLSGEVTFDNGEIRNAIVEHAVINSGTVTNAEFKGTTSISGNTTITGQATVGEVDAEALHAGLVQYRKHILKWGVEGVVNDSIVGPVSGDIWAGSQSDLEAAGFFPEPTWCDCVYVPSQIIENSNTVQILWGAPGELGDVPITYGVTGSPYIPTFLIAMWPYRMYEKVTGGFRIRWLPIGDKAGMITYARTGYVDAADGLLAPKMATSITEVMSGTGLAVALATVKTLPSYHCVRFIAETEESSASGVSTTVHRLYRM